MGGIRQKYHAFTHGVSHIARKANNKIREKLYLKVETDEERELRKEKEDPFAHRVQTGVSLSRKDLKSLDGTSDNFKKKENLVKRLIHVQKNSNFMNLLTNLPTADGEEAGKWKDKLDKPKEYTGVVKEGLDDGTDIVDSGFEIAGEAYKNAKEIPGVMTCVKSVIGTVTDVKEFVGEFIHKNDKKLTWQDVLKYVDNAIKSLTSMEGTASTFIENYGKKVLAGFVKRAPLIGTCLSIIKDSIHLVRTIVTVLSNRSERNETKEFLKTNEWSQYSLYGDDREARREHALSMDGLGNTVDYKTMDDDKYRLNWLQTMQDKKNYLRRQNQGTLFDKDQKELEKITNRDRDMRSLIAYEMYRKQTIGYREAWKDLAQTIVNFTGDVTSFINPLASAITSGVNTVISAGSYISKMIHKYAFNHEKKDKARKVFASYLYNHMYMIHESKQVENGKFVYPIPDDPEEAGNYVMKDTFHHRGDDDAVAQGEFYELADNASYTEHMLTANGMNYGKAAKKKTRSGLIDMMAESFSSQ